MWGNLPEKDEQQEISQPIPPLEEENGELEEHQLTQGEQKLFGSVKETLENMVFSPVEEIIVYYATIGIASPLEGKFTILISETLADNIASSMYAMSPDELTGTMTLDTVAEIANTICGQFIEAIIPEEQAFELTVPDTGKSKNFHFSEKAFIWPFTNSGEIFTVGIEGEEILNKLQQAE